MTEVETIDLSNEPLPTRIADKEFDEKFIGNAIAYLKDIRDNSKDYVTPIQKMEIKQTGNKWEIWIDSPDGVKVFKPTKWAENQTIGATELPKKYHDILIEKGHVMEAVNHLNMWLHEDQNKQFQVRSVGDQYRAIVSPGYNAFDNYDLFITIANSLKAANLMRETTTKPAKYYKAQVSDHNLYVHIIDEGREWDLGKGDTYKPMLIVKNSEVGDGALRVDAGLWRYMCGNLQLHGIVSRKIHSGEKLEEGIWSADTRQAQSELWKRIIRDSLNAGLASDQLFEPILDGLRESKEIKIEDPIVTIKTIKKATKMTDEEEKSIIAAMMGDSTVTPEDKGTLFQIVNGITQASKGMGIERGMELNKIAGDMKTLIKIAA